MDFATYVQGFVSKIHKSITQLDHRLRNAWFSECCLSPQRKIKTIHISVTGHVYKQLQLKKVTSLQPVGIHTAFLPKQVLHKRQKERQEGSYTSPLPYEQAENSPETQET